MAYFGGGGQNGATGRGGSGANPQTLLQGTQLFVNPNQIQFQGGGNQNYSAYSQGDNSQSQLQLSAGGTPLLLQPPVNFVTDQIGLGQLISQAAVTQNQQNLQNMMNLGNVMNSPMQMSEGGSSGTTPKQRVFTGTVTKIHDNFGFIDEEVFFSMQVVKGPVLPKEGDRVLVEADFNPTMPFKWTSTRVQIVNMAGGTSHASQASSGGYPYNSPISSVNKSLAPPPPAISGRPQPVAIVSNPHSVYSSRPSMTETMPSRRVLPLSSSDSSIMSTGVNSMNSMAGGGGGGGGGSGGGMMGGGIGGTMNDVGHRPMSGGISDNLRMNDRDLQRKDKDRLPARDLMSRERERSKERQTKDRDRRERSPRDREGRRRSRSRSRDRRSKRDPSPARKRSRERDRGRDRSAAVKERSPKASADQRSRRSRSRDTIKSADGRSVRSSVSPHRKGSKATLSTSKSPRYAVQPPQFSFDMLELNGTEIKRRYPNLYIPSDFFLAKATWMQAFPLHQPYALGNSTIVHIFGRHVQQLEVPDPQGFNAKFKQVSSVHPAPDASCTFTVKVMLLSCATLPTILKKCGCTNEDVVDEKETNQPLMRLLQFAVGVKSGAHEVIALGGSWSPSLDGLNPQSDPKVLVNTALRCVKAQAGIDLTRVSKWYRFMELYYRRNNGNLETVVYFLPETNPSTIPGQMEWDSIRATYRLALYGKEVAPAVAAVSTTTTTNSEAAVSSVEGEEGSKPVGDDMTGEETQRQKATETSTADGEGGAAVEDEKVGETEKLDEILQMEVVDECNGDDAPEAANEDVANPAVSKMDNSFDIYEGIVEVEKEPPSSEESEKIKLPLVSIDPKSMTVVKLREELSHRNLNTKGLKQELVARLTQALKDDEEEAAAKESTTNDESKGAETPPAEPTGNSISIKKEPDELNESQSKIKIVDPCSIMDASTEGEEEAEDIVIKQEPADDGEFPIIKESMSAEEKKVWERRYSVPKTPKLLVYPSTGDPSRDCTLMSLSTLRDYRASDKKEESFEVSLFSEFFYEMLQRDFAFKIYRELRKEYRKVSPEKVKTEVEEEKKEESSSEPATKRRKTSTDATPTTTEKSKVVDPMLLLAFSFFDTTRCGYIMEVDLEEICASIGIGITKRTIRKMAQKVVSKGSLHYRKLTDKPESEVGEVSNDDADNIKKLAMGNKVMLPVFSFSETEIVIDDSAGADGDGTVNGETASPVNAVVDGQVVDVRHMKDKLEKTEKALSTAEASVNVLKNSLNEAKNHVSELQKSNDSLKEKLNKTKETLKKTEASDKAAKVDLEVFKRASERFVDRIKGLVKLPSSSKDSSKETNSRDKSSSSKTKETSVEKEKRVVTPVVEDSENSSSTATVNASEK